MDGSFRRADSTLLTPALLAAFAGIPKCPTSQLKSRREYTEIPRVADLRPGDGPVEAADIHGIVRGTEADCTVRSRGDATVDLVAVLVGIDDCERQAAGLVDRRAAGARDSLDEIGQFLLGGRGRASQLYPQHDVDLTGVDPARDWNCSSR